MKRIVKGQARGQATLFPERLDDFVGEDNPVRVVDVFAEELELRDLCFTRAYPSRKHQAIRPKGCSAERTFATCRRPTNISAPTASG